MQDIDRLAIPRDVSPPRVNPRGGRRVSKNLVLAVIGAVAAVDRAVSLVTRRREPETPVVIRLAPRQQPTRYGATRQDAQAA